jgi:hypothetical protein
MISKYKLLEFAPAIDLLGNVARAAGEIIFDWTPIEVPKGTVCLKTLQCVITGNNGVDVVGTRDLELFYAKNIDGVAPPTLGTSGAAITAATAATCRRHIIGRSFMDGSGMRGSVHLLGYNVWSFSGNSGNDREDYQLMLDGGDAVYAGTTPGFQTIWVAAIAETADIDLGTGVVLAMEGSVNLAVSQSPQTIWVSGTDVRDVFAVGDELISFKASDGSLPKLLGTVTAVNSATEIVVDQVKSITLHGEEICFRRPLNFKLGFEY